MEEIWKPIINYEGLYEISNYGRVKSLPKKWQPKERILKPGRVGKYGHLHVLLYKNKFKKAHLVHRLVLENFIGPCPLGMESCHNDGNPDNNLMGNLRWDTHKNNVGDKRLHGTNNRNIVPIMRESENGNSKLNNWIVRIIKQLLKQKILKQKEIAKLFDITPATICDINKNKTWRHINE